MFPNPLAAAAPIVLGSLAALDLGALAMWYACSHPGSQWMAPSLVRGSGRRLALTFDDGPLPPYTGRILDVLAREAVAATFFVCGANAELYPETLKRIAADGHSIGNHTYTHPYLFSQSTQKIASEIDRTQDVVKRALGKAPVLFRPPYGGRWFGLRRVLRERQLQLVMWSDYHDAAPDPSAMTAEVLRSLAPGMILLMHDGAQRPGGFLRRRLRGMPALPADHTLQETTIAALPGVIQGARQAGYEFVTVDAFLQQP